MLKINRLEIENVKKIKAVQVEPTENGLTVIGGKNGQGKTSVLDAIAWALGGDRFRPSQATREGSMIPPEIKITLSNGLIVERKGKNSSLCVTDPKGQKTGQQLLDSFIGTFALNLPKFMNANSGDKAKILLGILGIGEELSRLDLEEKEAYQERLAIGRIADSKKKHAAEMPFYPDMPKEPISAQDLLAKHSEILAKNGENARLRDQVVVLQETLQTYEERKMALDAELTRLVFMIEETSKKLKIAKTSAEDLHDEATDEIERNLAEIDATNEKIRVNAEREKAQLDAEAYRIQYEDLTERIDDIRTKKIKLLSSAQLPLPGLTVEDGELKYNGFSWDNMSGSEQLKVATAIVSALNPECGFVLLDKLEQMDVETMKDFGAWLTEKGLQAIATRVSTGAECSIIIEDGYSEEVKPVQTKWQKGAF